MDIWEANLNAAVYTPHVCTSSGQTRCSGTQCVDDDTDKYSGICDKDGCDFNSYRMGDTSFLGPGKTVDTKSKFTVVTQFITSDNSTTGALTEIRRIYVQNGKVIQNSVVKGPSGIDPVNSITDNYCKQQKMAFGETNDFATKGGLAAMGKALASGMVLAMSIRDDHAANMLWLDSTYPLTKPATDPGVARGPCGTGTGKPADLEVVGAPSLVTFSNIKFGPIGSTYGH